ncbi:MAG: hypothetical protein OXE05_13750 [Chloroflexi bacterium]|nr:hypothetical protein [Chloroflexota bacterium]
MPKFDIFFQVGPFIEWGYSSAQFLSAVAITSNYAVFGAVMLGTLVILLAALDFWVFQFRRKKLWIDWDKPEEPFKPQPYDGP